jgi:hypothetical protein
MNRVRQMCATTLLTVVMATSTALAGDMPGGVTSPPPFPVERSVAGDLPRGTTSTLPSSDNPLNGEIPFGGVATLDPMTESMLGLLQSMLTFF